MGDQKPQGIISNNLKLTDLITSHEMHLDCVFFPLIQGPVHFNVVQALWQCSNNYELLQAWIHMVANTKCKQG